ncbi:MAG: hypothetical protein NTY02_15260 [Acidobacteria bacterium]|nr:hypothetical protein [Acidobacteriota bacterium]
MTALVLASAACGKKADTAPPMATPSVTANHTRIPLGSPVEVTYKFQVAQAAAFTKDYRVLVHFLDADEELMWTDEHNPPVPTSQWKPGQTVEYKRTVFVPLYPYVGEASVTLGLYAPGTNERVPLAGEAAGQREYRVARIRLQPQTENVFLAFLDGWHGPETAADNQTVEWQWMKKDATLRFRNPKRDALFYLHYDGQPSMFDTPQTVTVYLRDEVVDTFQVTTPDEGIRRISLKAAQFGADDMVVLRLSVDKTFVPALVKPGSKDIRELGVRVFHAFIEPQ